MIDKAPRRNHLSAAIVSLAMCMVVAMFYAGNGAGISARADAPATLPATTPGMTTEQLVNDMNATGDQIAKLIDSTEHLLDPKYRASVAPQLIPLLKHVESDADQIAVLQPEAKDEILQRLVMNEAYLSLFGDADTDAQLKKEAAGSGDSAISAQSAIVLADWLRNASDADAQAKSLAAAKSLAQANPQNDAVFNVIYTMSEVGAASPDLQTSAEKIITDDLKGPMAEQISQQIVAKQKVRQLEGKPMVVAGKQLDGKPFSTADWKGKVILVDFWATWCGPCVAGIPDVVKAYSEYHAKGLEIVGVSSDLKASDLQDFLAKHTEMAWPQLFDPDSAAKDGSNSVADGFGVEEFPTMFLIDKNGICRTVDARETFQEEIPKLLAEKGN